MTQNKTDWSKLESPLGNAAELPSLLEALTSKNKKQRAAAKAELPAWLIEDGDRYPATLAAIPQLVEALPRQDGEDQAWTIELLHWLAVSDPRVALREELAPPTRRGNDSAWYRAGEVNTQCFLEVMRATNQLEAVLAGNHVGAKLEVVALFANVPPEDPAALRGLCSAAGSSAPERLLRGLACFALAKHASYWKVSLDPGFWGRGKSPKGIELVLRSAARLWAEPSRAAWDALATALASQKRMSLAKDEQAALPSVLREGGWLCLVLALLARSELVDHARLNELIAPQVAKLDGDVLLAVAQGIFPEEPTRRYAGVPPASLSEVERGFLEALSRANAFEGEPHEWLTARGLPVGALDSFSVSEQRALKAYLGLEKPDAYRRTLKGKAGAKPLELPVYAWAHQLIREEIKPADFVGALLKSLTPTEVIDVVLAVSFPPRDLALAPQFDRRTLNAVALACFAKLKGAAKLVEARLEAGELEDGQALPLVAFQVAEGKLSDERLEELSQLLLVRNFPGTGELVRDILSQLPAEARDPVVSELDWDEVADTARDELIAAWEVAELASDLEAQAKRAIAAIREWDELATEAFQFARVRRALDALLPASRDAAKAALERAKKPSVSWSAPVASEGTRLLRSVAARD